MKGNREAELETGEVKCRQAEHPLLLQHRTGVRESFNQITLGRPCQHAGMCGGRMEESIVQTIGSCAPLMGLANRIAIDAVAGLLDGAGCSAPGYCVPRGCPMRHGWDGREGLPPLKASNNRTRH